VPTENSVATEYSGENKPPWKKTKAMRSNFSIALVGLRETIQLMVSVVFHDGLFSPPILFCLVLHVYVTTRLPFSDGC
jgi:hypothetical protein